MAVLWGEIEDRIFWTLGGRFWDFRITAVLWGRLETVSEGDCWVFRVFEWGSSSRFAPPVGMAPHATPYGGGPPKKHPRPLDSGLRRLSGLSVLRALESKEPDPAKVEDFSLLYWDCFLIMMNLFHSEMGNSNAVRALQPTVIYLRLNDHITFDP